MAYRWQRAIGFISEHPEATVIDVAEHLGTDAGGAWDALIDAQRMGQLDMEKPDGGSWRFTLISR